MDFPAAHSMDTTWWGVDRHGRLARFSTGEAGAVPIEVQEGSDVDMVQLLNATGGRPFYCDDLFPQPDGLVLMHPPRWRDASKQPIEVDASTECYLPTFLLWLRDERAKEIVEATDIGGRVAPLTVPGKIVVLLLPDWNAQDEKREPLLSIVLRWQKEGLLQRGWLYDLDGVELSRLGLFSYDLASFDNWICGPYTRESLPEAPLKLSDLPKELQEALVVCELDGVDFELDVLVQPYEQGEASSWEEQWVSTTGAILQVDDLEEELEPGDLEAVLAQPGSTTGALVAAYLRGEDGSADVIGDWLEENGRARLLEEHTPAARLDEVLLRWFAPEERLALEAQFVEHLLSTDPPSSEVAAAVSAVLDAVRAHLTSGTDAEELTVVARASFSAWAPEGGEGAEKSRVAWAGWALASRMPLVPARTVRAVRPLELGYQMACVVARVAGSA